jgi:hypothetical protein
MNVDGPATELQGRAATKAQDAAASAHHAVTSALTQVQDTAQVATDRAHEATSRAVEGDLGRAPEPVDRSVHQATDHRRRVVLGAIAVLLVLALARRHRARRTGS